MKNKGLFLLYILSLNWIHPSQGIRHLSIRDILIQQESNDRNYLQGVHDTNPSFNDIEELFIEQPLDHFNHFKSSDVSSDRKDVETLQQRFFYSGRFVSPSENILSSASKSTTFAFLCVGGEGPSLTKHVLLDSVHCSGDMLELAQLLYEV